MTMADTIAVMNAGRIEQLGSPTELYESPATTFVANFLGQSNLLPGRVGGRSGPDLLVDVFGRRLAVPAARNRCAGDDLLVGVRPEKIRLLTDPGDAVEGQNRLDGGVVVDASFTGVSTQYLVRMPWDAELTVFTQNLAVGGVLPVGTPVSLAWDPAHTFALEGDASAGAELEDALAGVG
jgi:spermidine/putrescine transport system ATP-binding protein